MAEDKAECALISGQGARKKAVPRYNCTMAEDKAEYEFIGGWGALALHAAPHTGKSFRFVRACVRAHARKIKAEFL